MTDYAALTGQPPAIDQSLEAFKVTPDGFMNGKGEPLWLTMHPTNGTRFKQAVRKMQIKAARADKDVDPDVEVTEDELDAELIKADGRTAELLARLCDGWNMHEPVVTRKGEDQSYARIKFDLENATALFAALETLRDAVDKEITAQGKKLKTAKAA